MCVSRRCCKSDPFKVICQFRHDGIGWKARVKFGSSHKSVVVSLYPSIVSQIKIIAVNLFLSLL